MKSKKITTILLAGIITFLFVGCSDLSLKVAQTNPRQIEKIDILTAEENPLNIYKIDWPEDYLSGNERIEFPTNNNSLSEEDNSFIISFAEEHENDEIGEKLLCRVCIYTVLDKSHYNICFDVYDEYPEDFNKFVEIINKICGSDKEYLYMNGNIQEITPEYVTAISGIDDEMVQGGTVKDIIELYDIKDIETLYYYQKQWKIDVFAENYSFISLLPFEVKSVESKDEEGYEYALRLAHLLGTDCVVTKEHSNDEDYQEWYQIKDYRGKILRVYRTCEIKENIIYYRDEDFENLVIYTPDIDNNGYNIDHPIYEFIYSNDYKFAIAIEDITLSPYLYDDEPFQIYNELATVIINLNIEDEIIEESEYNMILTGIEKNKNGGTTLSFMYKFDNQYFQGVIEDKKFYGIRVEKDEKFAEIMELDVDEDGVKEIIIKVNYEKHIGTAYRRIIVGNVHILKINSDGSYKEIADQDFSLNNLKDEKIYTMIIQDGKLYCQIVNEALFESLPEKYNEEDFRTACTYHQIYIEDEQVKTEKVDLTISQDAKVF